MKTALLLIAASTLALAQPPASQLTCDPFVYNSACTIQEAPVPFAGSLAADTGGNGGIDVRTWDGPGVWVRWQIRTYAENTFEAWSLFQQVHVDLSDGSVQAKGPNHTGWRSWSVTYEIFVPQPADLSLKTMNGGIDLTGVQGRVRFATMNGGVKLRALAGDVSGSTMNGGVDIFLAGDHWEGKGLAVKTMNGAISVSVPPVYSASFDLSNMIGSVNTDIPVPVKNNGILGHHVTFDTGAGGAPIAVSTMNGGIRITLAAQ